MVVIMLVMVMVVMMVIIVVTKIKVLCRFAYRLYILIHSYATKSNVVWYFT
jgi:hypothetical protein